MIPEPQRTYVLELLQELGPIADDFVVAGAQAMKFMLRQARATKDIDFVLNVVALRGEKESVAQTLQKLRYSVVPGSQNFQFQKAIPGSNEVMRIEFMAPEELKRGKDFRMGSTPPASVIYFQRVEGVLAVVDTILFWRV
jgi:hypothetical protein